MARRRFGDSPDADAAYNYALECVAADGWARLEQGYSGRGQPAAFLAVTFSRLLEEYAQRKYGRKRPPAWLKRRNGIWTRIYELLCLARQPAQSIVDAIVSNTEHPPEEIHRAIREVKGRIPDCGAYVGEYLDDEGLAGEGAAGAASSNGDGLEAALETEDLAQLIGALRAVFTPAVRAADDDEQRAAERLSQQLPSLRESLQMSDQERLLLQLRFEAGLSVVKAASQLGLAEHTARRMLRRVLDRLRGTLAPFGLFEEL